MLYRSIWDLVSKGPNIQQTVTVKIKITQIMEKLYIPLRELKSSYDKKREHNRFNIISALHKERDEVNLHSRMISYLLSPTSGHGMNGEYLHSFVREILKLDQEKFDLSKVSNVVVLPNENRKSEYKDIDLLIVNTLSRQAIIIENKIDAKDSNNDSKGDGYRGQLERYYNTIKLGIDKDGFGCKEYQCKEVYVYYLSLNKIPSDISIGVLKDKPESWGAQNMLSYDSHIREWLNKCIENTPDEKFQVKNFIEHYSNLIERLTHNDIPMEERIKLKNIVAENIADTKYLIENFNHVKWHTVHEFWTELKNNLEKQFEGVSFFVDGDFDFNKGIEIVTHQNKDINYGLVFDIKQKQAYISGFGKLSWGLVDPKKWSNFKDETIEDVNFYDFSSKSTYLLIDRTNMTNAVTTIIEEIKDSANNDFKTLN